MKSGPRPQDKIAVPDGEALFRSLFEQTGVGITASGPEELAGRWKEHRDARKRLFKERQAWSMNAHIHELEKFYGEVCAA